MYNITLGTPSEDEVAVIDRALTLLQRAASNPADAVSLMENLTLKDALDRGLALFAGKYPLHAVPTLLMYAEKIAEFYGERGEKSFKEKAAKAAWDIFWTKVMGYQTAPAMPGERKPLSEKERAAYEALLNKLAGYLDVAMSKAYAIWLSAKRTEQDVETNETIETPAKSVAVNDTSAKINETVATKKTAESVETNETPAKSVETVAKKKTAKSVETIETPAKLPPGLLVPVGEKEGKIRLQYWLDEVYRRWEALERLPLSEVFYMRLAELTNKAPNIHKATLEEIADALALGARKIQIVYDMLSESKKEMVKRAMNAYDALSKSKKERNKEERKEEEMNKGEINEEEKNKEERKERKKKKVGV